MLPQNSYRFKFSVTDSLGQSGFAEVDVHTESLPNSGRVEISPERGYHLDTVFSLRALDWTDERGDGPLKYRLGFQYDCVNQSARRCEEWMSGLTQDNQFFFTLPSIHSDLEPELVLRVSDRNGAVQHLTYSFDLLIDFVLFGDDSVDLLALLNQINTTIVSGYWVEGLSQLSSLIISADIDHKTIICSNSLSSQFQLSNREFMNFKAKALQVILYLYKVFIPASESHHETIISLLDKVLKMCCDTEPCSNPFLDTRMLLNTLEAIVEVTSRFEESGVLSQRGISREVAETVLSFYRQLIRATTRADQEASPIPRANHTAVAASFTRILPNIGYALCQRHNIFQDSAMIDLDVFMNMKSSLINLPPDYAVGGCLDQNCPFQPANIDFGSELFSRFLQYPCSVDNSESEEEEGNRWCSGVCVSSAQLYLNLFWNGSEFSSQIKTPILHLSLLYQSNSTPVVTNLPSSTSRPALTLPLVAEYSNTANLYCVVWDESALSWSNSFCDTEVMAGLSQVRCQCSAIGSLFYTVLERCPEGSYGVVCNQSKSGSDPVFNYALTVV